MILTQSPSSSIIDGIRKSAFPKEKVHDNMRLLFFKNNLYNISLIVDDLKTNKERKREAHKIELARMDKELLSKKMLSHLKDLFDANSN